MPKSKSGRSTVHIFVDGACSGNPGPGGWAAILQESTKERILTGFVPFTTNNRMELMAAIAGLESITKPSRIRVCSDSRYLIQGASAWMQKWKIDDWASAFNRKLKNIDLWQRLDSAGCDHCIKWTWVRGHSGHPENDRADRLARAAIERHTDG